MSEKNRCYWCKRIIDNENDIIAHNINTGFLKLSNERVAFHRVCLEDYFSMERKEIREKILYFTGAIIICAIIIALSLSYWGLI